MVWVGKVAAEIQTLVWTEGIMMMSHKSMKQFLNLGLPNCHLGILFKCTIFISTFRYSNAASLWLDPRSLDVSSILEDSDAVGPLRNTDSSGKTSRHKDQDLAPHSPGAIRYMSGPKEEPASCKELGSQA